MIDSEKRYAIILGSTKCGTTSVFEYLKGHPQVNQSKIKELNFFIPDEDLSRFSVFDERMTPSFYTGNSEYIDQFSTNDGGKVYVEASPNYVHIRKSMEVIARELKNLDVFYFLRLPSARFFSHFNFAKQINRIPQELTLKEFYDIQIRSFDDPEWETAPFYRCALLCCSYDKFIADALALFPRERVHIRFFEDLVARPRVFMRDVCDILQIDANYYDDYKFAAHNVTQRPRSPLIHQLVMGFRNKIYVPVKTRFKLEKYASIPRSFFRLYKQLNLVISRSTVGSQDFAKMHELRKLDQIQTSVLKDRYGLSPPW